MLDREWTEFSLGLSLGEITSFIASPQVFEPGEQVNIALEFENSGTVPISGTAQLEIQDETGQIVAAFSHPLIDLAAGQTMHLDEVWDTTWAARGAYRITAQVLYDAKATDVQGIGVRTWVPVYLPCVLRQWP